MLLHLSVILFTRGVSVQGGLCRGGSLSRGFSFMETPPHTVEERAVRFILECILVSFLVQSRALCKKKTTEKPKEGRVHIFHYFCNFFP